jgi:hypothetical protein
MSLSMSLDDRADDLPKALRNASLRTSDDISSGSASGSASDLPGAVVTDIRIPYWRLVLFLMKVALAALPALLIVALILYGVAEVLGTLFPQLVKLKIQIYVPPN